MVTCPVCQGEGHFDFRDDDARMSERYSDAELEDLRRRGGVHPLGIMPCGVCEETGFVDDDVAADIHAASIAMFDQLKAKWEEDEKIINLLWRRSL